MRTASSTTIDSFDTTGTLTVPYADLLAHVSVILIPAIFRPEALLPGARLFFRVTGAIAGLLMTVVMWDRRRMLQSLQTANKQLERHRCRVVSLISTLHASTLMISLPKFLPVSSPMNALGAFSSPLTMSSRDLILPSLTQVDISLKNSRNRFP